MTKFTTITELEILTEAYMSILDKWCRESERCTNAYIKGECDHIAEYRRDKHRARLDELHKAILALENAE
jgi:hypothetical protein